MSMSIGKRQIVLATLVVALGAAVFVNWYYTKPDAEKANTGVTVTEEVTQAAGNLGDALLVNSSSVSSQSNTKETKAQQAQAQVEDEYFAQARLNRSTAHDKLEADTENLINAKIGSPCVVVIGSNTAQVVVGKGVLKDAITVQIKEIVLKQTGFSVENVTIMEAK